MARKLEATVYIGNLHEKVDERVLYEIMVHAGPLVELHIPRDKDTKKHRGYAFAEYPSESVAKYAIKLFSGLVSLHNRPLHFRISGQSAAASEQLSPNVVQVSQKCLSPEIPNPRRASPMSPSASPYGSDYLYGHGSLGGRRIGSQMKTFAYRKSPLSNNSIVAERWNPHTSAMGHMGLRSSVSPCAFTSY